MVVVMTGSFGTCCTFFSAVSSMSRKVSETLQVYFPYTNTFPSETQGKLLKIKVTMSLKNTEGPSLTFLYSAKPFGICALLVCKPIPRLIFPLSLWKQNESSAITKNRGGGGEGRRRGGRDCHKYVFAGLGNLCNSLWISKVILSVWMIYISRTGCHICQLSTQEHLWFIRITHSWHIQVVLSLK